jgi:hypothetical protein
VYGRPGVEVGRLKVIPKKLPSPRSCKYLSKQVQAKGIKRNSMQLHIKPPTFISNSWLTKGYVPQVKVMMGAFQNKVGIVLYKEESTLQR